MKRLVVLVLAALAAVLAYAATVGPQATAVATGTAGATTSTPTVAAVASSGGSTAATTSVAPATVATKTRATTKASATSPVAPKTAGQTTASTTAKTAAKTAKIAARTKASKAAKVSTDNVAAKAVHVSLAVSRTAYLNTMYRAMVPAHQRAALAGHYTVGYQLSGLSCGTGCTGVANGKARSSFNAVFFGQPKANQRNILAHEAAHAYGFLYFSGYATASWAKAGGWQASFHAIDRSFVGHYDAEAWASCVAWKESGFNNRVIQISHVCTARAATLAMAQIK